MQTIVTKGKTSKGLLKGAYHCRRRLDVLTNVMGTAMREFSESDQAFKSEIISLATWMLQNPCLDHKREEFYIATKQRLIFLKGELFKNYKTLLRSRDQVTELSSVCCDRSVRFATEDFVHCNKSEMERVAEVMASAVKSMIILD
jgi:hypothetical protein